MGTQFATRGMRFAPLPLGPFAGYRCVFRDEFTAFNCDPAGSTGWASTYNPLTDQDRSNFGNSEQECYCDDTTAPAQTPFSFTPGGKGLRITASKASVTGANPLGFLYNSGLINTATTFNMQYGYYAVRARLMAGQGFWPAIWLQPSDGFTSFDEIDIMEMTNISTVIHQNVHYGALGDPHQTGPFDVPVTDASVNYHEYACDWRPDFINLYVDGQITKAWPTPVGRMSEPMRLIINFAVGGNYPGNADGTTPFPSFMDVDYVRIFTNQYSTNISGTRVL